ncbi:hypothetical protein AbraIFM66951_005983 [Aspergillus brasiliensis]|uniref:Thioesterase domain-containing protein n=1 Tax=Aspergillus brasiliensis TaxID=319629 RepID=A0A9W6DS47_9EURO|nr:hypothetical protein AbraCBS73388_005011 [Aspergillus brasiliensis]GKZ51527.1 hypothetical protein AbraIFM66951_005983 [Aspergillus brasiliensis]
MTAPQTPDTDEMGRLETVVAKHPKALQFKARDSVTERRYVLKFQPEDEPFNLTHGTLAGPDALSSRPYVFADNTSGSLLAFYHLGPRLSGHKGIVHGGLTAVILDECMGRACFPLLDGKIAVTAKLELEYKSPIPVDSLVYILAETTSQQGRKATVEATVRDAEDGRDLVKAKGLFVEPKWASTLTQVM